MARYHVNNKGEAGRCSAAKGNCPFGGENEHFDSLEKAREAYEGKQGSNLPTSSKKASEAAWETVVPEPVMEAQETQVPAGQLQYGTKVYLNNESRYVRGVKTGYKNAIVTVTDLKKGERSITVPLNQEVQAEVFNETKASVKARRAAQKELFLEKQVKNYSPKRDEVVAKINEKVSKGYALDGYNIGNLVEAEAKDTIMARYNHWVSDVKEYEPETLNPYSHALEKYRDELRNEVIQKSRHGNNVSTSESWNLFDRELQSAKAEFISSGPSVL